MYYNVTLKPGATDEDLEKAKEEVIETGGEIRHQYKLIKGFTVEYRDDHDKNRVIKSTEFVNVERDGPRPPQSATY
ncbi:hypothetical protein FQN57_006063 [Myotisia sp. PD_48]|nr:hypothetical protein FQN57_006063 [Myotisia sp. PD_48]